MYYIYSLLVALFIFALIQYHEYEKNKNTYNLYTVSNLVTLIIIYLILTIAFYTMFEVDYKCLNKIQKRPIHGGEPVIQVDYLKKISDDVSTGFRPSTSL